MTYLPVVLLGVLALVNLFVLAFVLWLTCKICRVRRYSAAEGTPPQVGIRYSRALAVVCGLLICGILTSLVLWLLVPPQSESDLRFSAFALILHVGLLLALVRLFVCPSMGRTVLVALLYEILGTLYVVGFVFAVNRTLLHSYVVPTGSMAETLLGYHKDVTCPACGQAFAINCSAEADPPEGRPVPTFACVCPNCRQFIHFPKAPRSYQVDHHDSILIDDPGLRGGDRFFAGRGLLGSDAIAPRRFDLVLHEFPFQRSALYVKRLVGLPGETIAIKGGDLYVLPADKAVKYDAAEAEQNPQEASEAKALMHVDDTEAVRRMEQGQFEILRKAPEQILALRRLVYHNDHPAKDQPRAGRARKAGTWPATGSAVQPAPPSFDPLDPKLGNWDDLKDPPFVTLYVQPGHYFLLGDNSPESADSRTWGAVSHRLLLARAFFVYYPWKRVGPLH